jgi:hypothetical protein
LRVTFVCFCVSCVSYYTRSCSRWYQLVYVQHPRCRHCRLPIWPVTKKCRRTVRTVHTCALHPPPSLIRSTSVYLPHCRSRLASLCPPIVVGAFVLPSRTYSTLRTLRPSSLLPSPFRLACIYVRMNLFGRLSPSRFCWSVVLYSTLMACVHRRCFVSVLCLLVALSASRHHFSCRSRFVVCTRDASACFTHVCAIRDRPLRYVDCFHFLRRINTSMLYVWAVIMFAHTLPL